MNKKIDLATVVKKVLETEMGYALDMMRMSDIGDRQMVQFEKSLKVHVRSTIKNTINLLKDYSDFEVDTSILERPAKEEEKEN